MHSLPAELHALILDSACASPSGGRTARALSLTNSYFHTIAAPFLYHTLVISSQHQAEVLLALLDATPGHQRQIRRLFLSPGLSSQTVLRLVYLAAASVLDLAVVSCSTVIGAIFRIPLPRLKSLYVRGFYPLPRPRAFPNLTHLHLAGNHSPAGLPASLAYACPSLTHLRVSTLRGAPAFARELYGVLLADGAKPVFLPYIQSVILEAQAPLDQANMDRVAQMRNQEMRKILLILSGAVGKQENAPHVEFLDGVEVDVDKIKIAWLDMACP
ncbi:hypothetical protein C8R43DRAFT_884680 [Mycena crocata]|nr:hypothetical protein C8R43DRAFT_884680 [Mycena crocata]